MELNVKTDKKFCGIFFNSVYPSTQKNIIAWQFEPDSYSVPTSL